MKLTGLYLFPRTQTDTQIIDDKLEKNGFLFEWDVEQGCFFFEENEDCYDELENQINEALTDSDTNYRIEGIF